MPPTTDAACVSEETSWVPSQVGRQPPPFGARMKASWKVFCPVALITGPRSGGSLSNGITYGAAPYQLPPSAAGVVVAALTSATAAAVPSAAATAAIAATSPRLRPGMVVFHR